MSRIRTRALALATTGVATAALGLFAAVAPANAATMPSSPAPSAKASACDAGAWETSVQGTPSSYKVGAHSGDYLWHDSHGFHLRVTHTAHDRRVYTGVITASAPMRYTPVKLEKGDIVKLQSDRKTLSFSFVNYGKVDGADFHTDCATNLTASRLHVGDRNLPTSEVYLGVLGVHPAHVPFTVHRAA